MRTPSSPCDACLRARERASLRADSELSVFETAALRAHLNGCPDCRAFAAVAEELTRQIRSTPLVEPDFSIQLPRRSYRSLAAIAPAVAAAAVVAVGVMQLSSFGTATVPGSPARVSSNAAALRADYTDRRLSRLFINGLAAISGNRSARLPASAVQTD